MQDFKPDFLKQAVTFLGGAVAMFYATGFVVVTTYMLGLGIIDISLARAQYISVGVFFILTATLTLLPTVWLTYILTNEIMKRVRTFGRLKLSKDLDSLISNIQTGGLIILMYILSVVFAPFTLFRLAADLGSGSEVVARLNQDMPTYYNQLWVIVPDWFAPLIGLGIFFGLIISFKNINGEVISKLKQQSSLVTPEGTPVKPKPLSFIFRIASFTVFISYTCTVPYLGLVAIHTYSTEIYPVIRPGFGGGNLGTVQFVTDLSGEKVLSSLVKMEDARTSAPVQLLGEGGSYYSVLLDPAHKRAVMIEKSLIKGIKSINIPYTKINGKPAAKENGVAKKPGQSP